MTDNGEYKGYHLTEEEYVTRVISPLSCQGFMEIDEPERCARCWGYRENGFKTSNERMS